MKHKGSVRIQDNVHGLMEFHGMETMVVDCLRTREVRRLLRVRQLGLVNAVYPCADHSRFVHALGSAHIALRFGNHLQRVTRSVWAPDLCPTETSVRDFAIAALCRDLGRGSLSRVWEKEVIGDYFDRESWISALGITDFPELLNNAEWHEIVTQGLLAWPDGDIHRMLELHESGLSTRIRLMLLGQYYLPYFPVLLSGEINVHRCDYVLRDSLQSGVRYGRYDLDQLISTCSVGEFAADKRLVIGFDTRKAPHIIEQILIARRALHDTVYCHKTVRAAECLAALFFRRMREVLSQEGAYADSDPIRRYSKVLRGETLNVEEVLHLDDYSLWMLLDRVADDDGMDGTAHDLAQRLRSRELLEPVPCDDETLRRFMDHPDWHEWLCLAIRPFCPGESEYYIYPDIWSLDVMSEDPAQWSFFLDVKREFPSATPIREHSLLRPHSDEGRRSTSLYTIPEAVDAVLTKFSNDS